MVPQQTAGSTGKCSRRVPWWLRVLARAVAVSERSHLVLEIWLDSWCELTASSGADLILPRVVAGSCIGRLEVARLWW